MEFSSDSIYAWMGNRIWEAQCISSWFPISFALTLEHSDSTIDGLSLEHLVGERRLWGSEDLTDPRLLQAAKSQQAKLSKCDWLLSYTPQSKLQPGLPKPLWKISTSLKMLWGDKLRTRFWFNEVGLPTLPFYEVSPLMEWPKIEGRMVLQELGKSCGSGTYIGTSEDLRRICCSLSLKNAMASPFQEGVVINGHVGVFNLEHIEIPWPSIQFVEFAAEQNHLLPLYAGNDFEAYQKLPVKVRFNVWNLLYKLGMSAAKRGYRGLLGGDILYCPENGMIYLLEVNARMQGSTGLLAKMEYAAGMTPIVVRLFLHMLGKEVQFVNYPKRLPEAFGTPIAQYIFRKDLPVTIEFESMPIYKYGSSCPTRILKYGVIERHVFGKMN